jgi:CMP-N,N'-diacetyllegionaminic acid synthase
MKKNNIIINSRVLAIIPARGGSKRLLRKNILPIDNHPMIAYSIKAAKEAKLITDWIVSSEDDEILKVAKKYGAKIPFKRPKELATGTVRNIDVVMHALKFMEESTRCKYDIIILLQPTSPIRSSEHIDLAITKLQNSKLSSLASVKGPFQKKDPILKRINDNGELVAYSLDSDTDQREPFYIYNASIYAVKRDYFVRERRLIADKQLPLIMDKYHSIDVDELADMIVAEAYLKKINEVKEN